MSEAGEDGAGRKACLQGLGASVWKDQGLSNLFVATISRMLPAPNSQLCYNRKPRVLRLVVSAGPSSYDTCEYQSEADFALDGAESGYKVHIFINYPQER